MNCSNLEIKFDLFRSIALLLEINKDGDDFTTPASVLADWIVSYDQWWKKSGGILQAKNLHLLYGRSISVFGTGILQLTNKLEELIAASTNLGYTFLLRVDLDESVENLDNLLRLIDRGVRSIIFDSTKSIEFSINPQARRLVVECLVEKKVSVALLGPIKFWRETGIIGSAVLDSTNFQIIPATLKSQIRKIVKDSISRITPTIGQSAPATDDNVASEIFFNPCSRRFQVFVAPDGRLYPCNGLVGIERYMLGEVYDKLEDTILGSRNDVYCDLEKLAAIGPQLSPDAALQEPSELPAICAVHREWLEGLCRSNNAPEHAL